MHLQSSTHGTTVAFSDPDSGLVFILSPEDDIDPANWRAACAEHDVDEFAFDWDFRQCLGYCAWGLRRAVGGDGEIEDSVL